VQGRAFIAGSPEVKEIAFIAGSPEVKEIAEIGILFLRV
jgi:hypothetical protein